MKIRSLIQKLILSFIKPCLIFESYPNFADNTKYVFDEFVKRDYEKEYYLYWFIDYDKAASYHNGEIEYWNPKDKRSIKKYIRHLRYYKKYKATIFCNRLIVPEVFSNSQNSFYLGHGVPLKNSSKYYQTPNEIEYCISPSEAMRDIISYGHGYDKNKIIALGYPRNDAFYNCNLDVKDILSCRDTNKVIVWYPTFKQHKSGIRTGSAHSIPFIFKEEKAKELNAFLDSHNVYLVVKPHFGQDLDYVKRIELSNIRFINDDFYKSHSILSYEFVGACDALLTDYSSVLFDFTLCDKPIGLIWNDIEEYKINPGLNPNYEYLTQGMYKIYTFEDLKSFITSVSDETDAFAEKRREMSMIFNISKDGKNASRVVDFIVDKAQL